jgi:uncharacterized Rmd1/YagE family protein
MTQSVSSFASYFPPESSMITQPFPFWQDLKKEGTIRLSRQEVLKKLGALFALRHSINFSSELLDETPDFYWDREHLEPLYQNMKEYLNISKRTKVRFVQLVISD